MPCLFRPGAPASYAGLELKEPSVKPDLTAEYLAATSLSGVRRREGLRCLWVELHETELDALVRVGLLEPQCARRSRP
jgi:hypothetical protein